MPFANIAFVGKPDCLALNTTIQSKDEMINATHLSVTG